MALSSFSRFDSNIAAVRDLALNAKAHTKPLDDRRAYFLKSVRRWNVHESDESVFNLLDDVIDRWKETLDGIRARLDRGEELDMSIPKAMRLARDAAIDAHSEDPSDRFRYYLDVERAFDRRPRNLALNSSLLISAAASFEVLVSGIANAYMTAFPEAMTSSENNISTEYLQKFETIDQFWSAYRAKRVEKLMRDDVEAWLEWIERHLRVNREHSSPNRNNLIEIFLTRNIHIHNAGIVNEIYLNSARQSGFEPRRKQVGSELPISQKYLLESIELLQVTGNIATYGALRKFDSKLPADEATADIWLQDAVYDLLEAERNEALLDFCSLARNISGSQPDVIRVNVWVALKETQGIDVIEDDVRAWDTQTLDRRFQLVKLALLEDYLAAHAIADEIYGTDELARADWNSWPVLKGLREWVSSDPDRGSFLLRDTVELGE